MPFPPLKFPHAQVVIALDGHPFSPSDASIKEWLNYRRNTSGPLPRRAVNSAGEDLDAQLQRRFKDDPQTCLPGRSTITSAVPGHSRISIDASRPKHLLSVDWARRLVFINGACFRAPPISAAARGGRTSSPTPGPSRSSTAPPARPALHPLP